MVEKVDPMIAALVSEFWPYLLAAGGALLALVGARASGSRKAKLKMEVKDHERAEEIRNNVRDNIPERVREYDDSGWRD